MSYKTIANMNNILNKLEYFKYLTMGLAEVCSTSNYPDDGDEWVQSWVRMSKKTFIRQYQISEDAFQWLWMKGMPLHYVKDDDGKDTKFCYVVMAEFREWLERFEGLWQRRTID